MATTFPPFFPAGFPAASGFPAGFAATTTRAPRARAFPSLVAVRVDRNPCARARSPFDRIARARSTRVAGALARAAETPLAAIISPNDDQKITTTTTLERMRSCVFERSSTKARDDESRRRSHVVRSRRGRRVFGRSVGPSVGRSLHRSVGPSVRPSIRRSVRPSYDEFT